LSCLSILAVLALVAVPTVQLTYQRTKEQALRESLREIRQAIDSYKRATDEGRIIKAADESGYPRTLEDLSAALQNAKQPSSEAQPIRFLRRIPRDPLAKDLQLSPAQTWGLRSYRSSDEQPTSGADVYDIYSLSAETGLNGIAYRRW
jgi:general secretion pathway protein G